MNATSVQQAVLGARCRSDASHFIHGGAGPSSDVGAAARALLARPLSSRPFLTLHHLHQSINDCPLLHVICFPLPPKTSRELRNPRALSGIRYNRDIGEWHLLMLTKSECFANLQYSWCIEACFTGRRLAQSERVRLSFSESLANSRYLRSAAHSSILGILQHSCRMAILDAV